MGYLDLKLKALYRFDGCHPAKWLATMKKYFELDHVDDDYNQLKMGSNYLDYEIRQWYLGNECGYGRFLTWDAFKKALMDQFDRKIFVDKLTQTDTQLSKGFIFTGNKETKEPKRLFLLVSPYYRFMD